MPKRAKEQAVWTLYWTIARDFIGYESMKLKLVVAVKSY